MAHPTVKKLWSPNDIKKGPYEARIADFIAAGDDARHRHQFTPAAEDTRRIAVIIVDFQHDFVDPTGTLPVPGAQDDVNRFLTWFYRNAHQITSVYATLDTHLPNQIFFSTWWRHGKSGEHPKPFDEITVEQVERGEWVPLYEVEWSRQYVRLLRENAKRTLMIWPFHVLEGTLGHMLAAPLSEAIAWHSTARDAQPTYVVKGRTVRTEYYGLFGAEIPDPNDEQSDLNIPLLDAVMKHDLVYVAGEAKSHCVLESMRQLVARFRGQPKLMQRINFLIDCTSSIKSTPQHNFEEETNTILGRMRDQGVRMVRSSEPLP